MDDPLENTAEETIRELTLRLRRLEYLLLGNDSPVADLVDPSKITRESSVLARINHLDKKLTALYSHSHTVHNLLDLYVQFPELFRDPTLPTPLPQHLFPASPDIPSTLTTGEKLATVLATASSFQSFSSQLNAIMDSPIPNPSTSTELISLIPRINKTELLQESQMKEIAALRKRTAQVLERWYLVGVEGINECFAEWDERTLEVEKSLTRILNTAQES
ncbi:hypothetical protein BDZ91DRAFT_776877 [Kalaharituber pfeilii]|nr:hypothetical protein BDZ91DRAFT_776877 [Kalaharituber pfeilii]